jgi:hypothetical protein
MDNEYPLQKFLDGEDRVTEVSGFKFKVLAPQLVLMDGTRISVQAGEGRYSDPRRNHGPYTEVEIGYPSREFAKLMPYAKDPKQPTNTVYGYVPVEVLEEVIAACGGVNWTWTFLSAKK